MTKRKFCPSRTHEIRQEYDRNRRQLRAVNERITVLGLPWKDIQTLQDHQYAWCNDLYKVLPTEPEKLFVLDGITPEIVQRIVEELGLEEIPPSRLRACCRKAKRTAKIQREKVLQNERAGIDSELPVQV